MTTHFENCLADLEEDFGFEYTGGITQSCGCEMCTDETIAEIRAEMVTEQQRQEAEMQSMKRLYDAEVHYGIHVPEGAK